MNELDRFASLKRLPVDELRRCGFSHNGSSILIDYGPGARARVRHNAQTAHPTTWVNGDTRPMRVFGHHYVEQAGAKCDVLFIVEGESDAATLWHHKRAAIGVPGATMANVIEHEDVGPFAEAIIVREPGDAGTRFVLLVASRLRHLGFTGEIYEISLAPQKDVSDLHISVGGDEDKFASLLDGALKRTAVVDETRPCGNSLETGTAAGRLRIVTLADVSPEPIEWLWRGRVARGKVTLVVGDPGAGKSFVTLGLSAAVTTGHALPDDPSKHEAGNVLLWNGEDGIADTIRVRAEACGVNLSSLHVIEGVLEDDGRTSSFSLSALYLLEEEIKRRGDVRLVVIDPLSALLAGVDTHRDADVRSQLQPLADFARRNNVAVVCVLHLRKNEAARSLYRVGGSIGFVGLARSVLLVARDEETNRRAIVPLKGNLSAPVDPVEFDLDAEGGFWWRSCAPDLTAERLLAAPEPEEDRTALGEAQDAIREALAGGELPAKELERVVRAEGVHQKTLERARARLRDAGKIERLGGGKYGPIRWRLAGSPGHDWSSRPSDSHGRDEQTWPREGDDAEETVIESQRRRASSVPRSVGS